MDISYYFNTYLILPQNEKYPKKCLLLNVNPRSGTRTAIKNYCRGTENRTQPTWSQTKRTTNIRCPVRNPFRKRILIYFLNIFFPFQTLDIFPLLLHQTYLNMLHNTLIQMEF